jgi:hypothetical protein
MQLDGVTLYIMKMGMLQLVEKNLLSRKEIFAEQLIQKPANFINFLQKRKSA